MNITTNTSLTELFEIVKVSLNELNSGEIFIVKHNKYHILKKCKN